MGYVQVPANLKEIGRKEGKLLHESYSLG